MTSIEDRFNAAVNVIKNLPKNGSYQPSNAMMLSFYAYYKQSTMGPCKQKKPQFWDVVGKAKWDSWSALGDMPKERAMQLYVDELRKIIETMSYTENVANFMGSISELDNVNLDDLEAVAPDIMKAARSHPNSPFSSRCNSPQPGQPINGEAQQNGHTNGSGGESESSDTFMVPKSHQSQTVDQSDDEYTDTVEDTLEMPSFRKQVKSQSVHPYHNTPSELSDAPVLANAEPRRDFEASQLVLVQIQDSIRRLSADYAAINQRMNALEKNLSEVTFVLKKMRTQRRPEWWPLQDISPQWFIFLILWPFLANYMARTIRRRK